MTEEVKIRKDLKVIENRYVDFDSAIYLYDVFGAERVDSLTKEDLRDKHYCKAVANKFTWVNPEGKTCIVVQGMYVLMKKHYLLSDSWHYGQISLFGNIITTERTYELAEVDELWEVSPEEFFINTSRNYLELHPDLQYLKNINTNDYLM